MSAGRELCENCLRAFERVLAPAVALLPDAECAPPPGAATAVAPVMTAAAPPGPEEPLPGGACESSLAASDEEVDATRAAAPLTIEVQIDSRARIEQAPPAPWWEVTPAAARATAPPPAPPAPPERDAPVQAAPPAPAAAMVPAPATTERPTLPIKVDEQWSGAARQRRWRPPATPRKRAAGRLTTGRLMSAAIGGAALCLVALMGAPQALDHLSWGATRPEPRDGVVPAAPCDPQPDVTCAGVATPAAEAPTATAPVDQKAGGSSTPAQPKLPVQADSTPTPPRTPKPPKPRAAAPTPPPAPAAPAEPTPVVLQARAAAPIAAPPIVAAPAPTPAPVDLGTPFELTQVDVRPQITRQVAPRVPDGATKPEVVVVRVLVSPAGRAADVRVVRGARDNRAYDEAAVAAVKEWTFTPAQKRAKAVSCWMHVGVPVGGA